MKKKFISLLLASILMLSACGKNSATDVSTSQPESQNTENSVSEMQGSETSSESLDSLGDIEVDKKIFDVEITVPSDYVYGQTQEDLDKISNEHGFKSIVLNEDGSATYTMTKNQHKELLAEYREQINNDLNGMVSSEEYPNFTSIEANDNYTEFTVTTKSTELDMVESVSVMAFYMYSGLYNIFSGEAIDNVSVTFINDETGNIISTSNSKDLQQ